MKRPLILLVNPWIHDFAAYDLWARPLGLLVLAARLRRMGLEPMLIDCVAAEHPAMPSRKTKPDGRGRFLKTPIDKPACIAHVPRTFSRYGLPPEIVEQDLARLPRPQAIFVTSLMTYWYTGVRETIMLVRKAFPGVPVVLGGVYATLMPDHALQVCAPDEVWSGPGEPGLSKILGRLLGRGFAKVEDGPEWEFSACLDLMGNASFLPLLTSRGCPMRCSYCASARLFPRFVARPAQDAVRCIEQALQQYGIQDVVVYDDAFLYDAASRALPILQACAERFPHLRWHAPNGLHVRYITREVALAMKRAGFETIRLGLESSADAFHRRTGGKTGRQEFISAVSHLRDAGFTAKNVAAYLLVGLPTQTRAQIEDDVDFVLRAGAAPKLAEYSPIPGTALWEAAVRRRRYDIANEPLFHNCTLLPAAEEEVDSRFLADMRRKISQQVLLTLQGHVDT
uniref:Radical SAM protein n=1 Tax=Desulfomonile tiedjei TaxID=2358 RepID=A0A7C4ASF1_9BACT